MNGIYPNYVGRTQQSRLDALYPDWIQITSVPGVLLDSSVCAKAYWSQYENTDAFFDAANGQPWIDSELWVDIGYWREFSTPHDIPMKAVWSFDTSGVGTLETTVSTTAVSIQSYSVKGLFDDKNILWQDHELWVDSEYWDEYPDTEVVATAVWTPSTYAEGVVTVSVQAEGVVMQIIAQTGVWTSSVTANAEFESDIVATALLEVC